MSRRPSAVCRIGPGMARARSPAPHTPRARLDEGQMTACGNLICPDRHTCACRFAGDRVQVPCGLAAHARTRGRGGEDGGPGPPRQGGDEGGERCCQVLVITDGDARPGPVHDTDVVVPVDVASGWPFVCVRAKAVKVPAARVRTKAGAPPPMVRYHPPMAHVPIAGHVTDKSTVFWLLPVPDPCGSGACAALRSHWTGCRRSRNRGLWPLYMSPRRHRRPPPGTRWPAGRRPVLHRSPLWRARRRGHAPRRAREGLDQGTGLSCRFGVVADGETRRRTGAGHRVEVGDLCGPSGGVAGQRDGQRGPRARRVHRAHWRVGNCRRVCMRLPVVAHGDARSGCRARGGVDEGCGCGPGGPARWDRDRGGG